jgi:hypothetical protein
MIYITLKRGGPKFSNTTARALTYSTAVQQRQLKAKWLLCSYVSRSPLIHVVGRSFCLYTDSLFTQIGDSNDRCSSSSIILNHPVYRSLNSSNWCEINKCGFSHSFLLSSVFCRVPYVLWFYGRLDS